MKNLRAWIVAGSVAAVCAVPVAAFASLSGNYLVTLSGAHPASYNGTQFCAMLDDNGSVLGWVNSGSVTINNQSGQFFVHKQNLAAWIVSNSGTQQYAARIIGHGMGIQFTSFAYLDSSGNAYATGSMHNQHKGSC